MYYIPSQDKLSGKDHMAIAVINAVIHGFEKDQHTLGVPEDRVFKRPDTLDATKEAVIVLVESVAKLLGKKDNTLAWGRFSTDRERGPFPESFKVSVTPRPGEVDLSDPNLFHALTITAMDEIVRQAGRNRLSTGSKILFSYYCDENGKNNLLIAMIKQKGGIQLTKDYEPVNIEQVDMSKLSHAAEIKCTEFLEVTASEEENANLENPDEDFEIKPYLAFMSTRDSDGSADYFINALGCAVHRSSKKSTSMIINAAYDICKKDKDLKPYAANVRDAVRKYLAKQLESGNPATLEDVKNVIVRELPAELIPRMDNFVETMNGVDYRLPTEFEVSDEALEKFTRFVLKDDDLEIKFDKTDFGVGDNSKIKYDQKEKTIRINLTDEQAAKFDNLLKENV